MIWPIGDQIKYQAPCWRSNSTDSLTDAAKSLKQVVASQKPKPKKKPAKKKPAKRPKQVESGDSDEDMDDEEEDSDDDEVTSKD